MESREDMTRSESSVHGYSRILHVIILVTRILIEEMSAQWFCENVSHFENPTQSEVPSLLTAEIIWTCSQIDNKCMHCYEDWANPSEES